MVWALSKEGAKAAKIAKSAKGTKAVIDSCTHRVADQIGWSNWGGEITTLAPVFRVKTDKDLRQIIKYSKKDGACKVRVTGATHSEDGLVMQRLQIPNQLFFSALKMRFSASIRRST
jgi:hypothetical protein